MSGFFKVPEKTYTIGLLTLLAITIIVGIQMTNNKSNNQEILDTVFVVDYENKSTKSTKIRYKYILTYETADSLEAPKDWDTNEPLFTLMTKPESDNFFREQVVSSTQLDLDRFYNDNESKTPIIPDVSNAFTLKPNEHIEDVFEMMVHPQAEEIRNMIRFEVQIIIEELVEGKWTPVSQVILMERGPYFSLDKGPIEYLK